MRDIRAELLQKPMNRFQMLVIALMVLLNGYDGYDVLAMAFAAPLVGAEMGIGADTIGWLISAGLIGMMAGSLLIAPFADTIGRKKLILIAMAVDGIGLLGSALSNGVVGLFFWRLVTGLGIGAMLASVASMTAEFANARHRSLCVSIMAIGYPAGAVLGGLVAAALVSATGDWRPIFWFGFIITAGTFPLLLLMPESLEFLVGKRPKGALQTLNRLLPRLGMAPVDQLPAPMPGEDETRLYKVLWNDHGRSLGLITAAYFMFAATLYFPLQWMTYMLTESGLSPEMGISGSVLMNGGGVIGGLLFGVIAAKWGGLRNTVPVFMMLSVLSIIAFGFAPNLTVMLVLGAIIGFGLIGTVSGMYSTYPVIFPPAVRTTGAGIVIGLGRIGGIISPVVAGYMIEGGVSRPVYCVILALPLVFAIALLRAIDELKSPLARGEVDSGAAGAGLPV
jgi:MFS family permease